MFPPPLWERMGPDLAMLTPLCRLRRHLPLFSSSWRGERGAWGMAGNLPLYDTASHAHEYIFRIIA